MSVPVRNIRVVLIAGQLGMGGAERQLFRLLEGLVEDGFEPTVLTLNPGAGDHWETRIREAGIPVIGIDRTHGPKRAWTVHREVRRARPHLVHSFHYFTNGYAALAGRLSSCPSVGSIRFLPSNERLRETPIALWRRICLRGVDRLICNSEAARCMLVREHPGLSDPLVIPNGIACASDERVEAQRREARRNLKLPPDARLIGFVGSLNPNKNAALLLDALTRLAPDASSLRVVIVGDGPSRPTLEKQAADLGLDPVVRFLGARPADELMPAFDVLCLTSNSEGMPNVLMEAAAAGVPTVASNVGGVSEIVRDGRTGLLFPAGDAEALARNLRRLISDSGERSSMATESRRRILERHSLERMVRAYRDVYLSLLGRVTTTRGSMAS